MEGLLPPQFQLTRARTRGLPVTPVLCKSMSDHWKDSRAWQRMAEQQAAWANQLAKLWGVCLKAGGSALVGAATESYGNLHYGTTENKNKWWEGLGWSLWGGGGKSGHAGTAGLQLALPMVTVWCCHGHSLEMGSDSGFCLGLRR